MSGRKRKTEIEKSLDKDIGARIRYRREMMNMSTNDLASQMNYSIEHIRKMEEGVRTPGIQAVIQLSEILNTSTDYILRGVEFPGVSGVCEIIQYALTDLQRLMTFAEKYRGMNSDK